MMENFLVMLDASSDEDIDVENVSGDTLVIDWSQELYLVSRVKVQVIVFAVPSRPTLCGSCLTSRRRYIFAK